MPKCRWGMYLRRKRRKVGDLCFVFFIYAIFLFLLFPNPSFLLSVNQPIQPYPSVGIPLDNHFPLYLSSPSCRLFHWETEELCQHVQFISTHPPCFFSLFVPSFLVYVRYLLRVRILINLFSSLKTSMIAGTMALLAHATQGEGSGGG